MGYNNKWPLALIYGDHHFCGLQLRNHELESLIRKIKKYLTSYDETRHIKTGEYNDLLVSTCRRFLSLILENYPHNVSYINNHRFTELIKILQKYGVE